MHDIILPHFFQPHSLLSTDVQKASSLILDFFLSHDKNVDKKEETVRICYVGSLEYMI